MNQRVFSLIVLFLSVSLISSCQQPVNKNNQKEIINSDKAEESQFEADDTKIEEQEPTDDEIREFGIIVNVEDGVYPMFIVTIEFPERQMEFDFNLNIESVAIDSEKLYNLKGSYITFYYVIDDDNNIYDIRFKGKSLLGEYASQIEGCDEITGILSGAEKETNSDLPDDMIVTDENGRKVIFVDFITPEMVEVNGKETTVYYRTRSSETITYIQPSEN